MNDETDQNEQLIRAYRLAFGSPAGQAVLADLAPFCRAAEPCFHENSRIHHALEGRREVWLRIQKYMNLNEQDILELSMRRTRIKAGDLSDG